MNTAKLRVLCLHGYTQNEHIMRKKTSFLRKDFKNVDFVYVSAPNCVEVPDGEVDKSEEDVSLKWFGTTNDTKALVGLEESIQTINKAWIDQGPFDGMLGFSQGSALITLYIIFQLISTPPSLFLPRFVILFSSPFKQTEVIEMLGERKIDIPSLHVIGESDTWVLPARSREMAELYVDHQMCMHPGSHFVPSGTEQRMIYREFIQTFAHTLTI